MKPVIVEQKTNLVPLSDLGVVNARVRDIILDSTHPEFERFGEWSGIGTIRFEIVNNPIGSSNLIDLPFARPYLSNIYSYPLINEIVQIFSLPSYDININLDTNIDRFYYLLPVNVWNNNHHNVLPDEIFKEDNIRSKDFKEDSEIRQIKVKEGDVVYSGRYNSHLKYSNGINVNSPFTYLVTGFKDNIQQDPWIPYEVNVNEDKNVIFQSNNNTLDLKLNYKFSFLSYKKLADFSTYNLAQTGIISDRVIIYAKKDIVSLHSNKGISLSSNEDIGIESKNNIQIDSNKIILGSRENAKESVLKADTFLEDLKNYNQTMSTFLTKLSTLVGNLGVPVATPLLADISKLKVNLNKMNSKISTYKSKKTVIE